MEETNSIQAVTRTMVAQLGGRQIFAMAFEGSAWGHDGDEAVLTLRIARPLVKATKGKATHVTVRLAANDTYTVKAIRCRGANVTDVASQEMVYGDQLRAVVESMTGLRINMTYQPAETNMIPVDLPPTIHPITTDGWYEHVDGTFGFYCHAARGATCTQYARTGAEAVKTDEHGTVYEVGWPARILDEDYRAHLDSEVQS